MINGSRISNRSLQMGEVSGKGLREGMTCNSIKKIYNQDFPIKSVTVKKPQMTGNSYMEISIDPFRKHLSREQSNCQIKPVKLQTLPILISSQSCLQDDNDLALILILITSPSAHAQQRQERRPEMTFPGAISICL